MSPSSTTSLLVQVNQTGLEYFHQQNSSMWFCMIKSLNAQIGGGVSCNSTPLFIVMDQGE